MGKHRKALRISKEERAALIERSEILGPSPYPAEDDSPYVGRHRSTEVDWQSPVRDSDGKLEGFAS